MFLPLSWRRSDTDADLPTFLLFSTLIEFFVADKSEYRHLNMHAPALPEFLCSRSRMVTSHWFKATSIFQWKVDSSVDLFAADMKYWEQLPCFCMYTKILRCWKDKDLLRHYRETIIQSVKLNIRWNKRLKFESRFATHLSLIFIVR